MKPTLIPAVAALTAGAAILALAGFAATAQAAPVHVTLTGVQPQGGHVLIQLQTRDQYGSPSDMVEGTVADGNTQGTLQFNFDVPPGAYAASVLHDANGNYDFDVDKNGKPLEGVTSSALLPTDGRPSFDQAAFTVGPNGADITMAMHYPN